MKTPPHFAEAEFGTMPSRRSALALAAAAVTGALVPAAAGEDDLSLSEAAAEKGLLFGAAVNSHLLEVPDYTEAVRRDSNVIVPEYELKRRDVEPRQGIFRFYGADRILQFAIGNKMSMRGHTLVWHESLPDWLSERLQSKPEEKLLTDYVGYLCKRYRGSIGSWDVVNEAVAPEQGRPDGLRATSPWLQAFGPGYLGTSFHAARDADPNALLVYNDYGVYASSPWHEARRRAVLNLCEKLVSEGAPIDAVGIQGHLRAYGRKIDEGGLSRFVSNLTGMGLRILVTEMDVQDTGGARSVLQRDQDVAAIAGQFLDVVLDNPKAIAVLTWGVSDLHSYLSVAPETRWPDGQLSRGLPLDREYRRKPLWYAIRRSLVSAPKRGGQR